MEYRLASINELIIMPLLHPDILSATALVIRCIRIKATCADAHASAGDDI